MPKTTQTQHEPSSDLGQGENLEQQRGERRRKESKVHRLSQGKGFYTPKKTEPKKPGLLTVDQYLRKAGHDKGISDLVRSMYKTEILSFDAWASKVKALLKKRI